MGSQERKTIIELPVKVILTEVGTTFFIKNKKNLRKFKLADNVEEYGIFMDRFTPASLQRMMLIDYVSKIEISNSEFVTIRPEVMDIAKLITYSMLYRQYDAYIFHRVMASDVIKNWNRKNPANIIDNKTKINESFLQNAIKEKEKDISEIKQTILAPMYAFISKNSSLLPEEKNIQLLLSEKYLNQLRPFIWFIVAKFKGMDGYETLIKDIRTSLAEYMEKAKIAEYVALNIMELATNAENSNLKREAKAIFKGAVDMNSVLFDPNVRRQVIDSLQRKGELVYLSWRLGSRGSSIGTQGRLQITIFNKESEYEKMKEAFDEKKSADLKKRSLQDFYKDLPDGEANTELGLYYLSYLSEACEKVNIKFESLVNQVSGSDLTVITLVINL
ncbi:MAG: hypothetical protein E4H20_04875 [Spirochaetales bacterium]|nr:MAG: hypothetical protein E4H20_04875 [Spirochaetales bacterium]